MRLPLPDYLEVVLSQMLARFPFFGILACQMPLTPDPEKAGGTASTDGTAIYYDPRFMERMRDLGDDCVGFILAHEVLHPALGHLWRVDDRDATRWNYACDVVINRILRDAGMPLPPGVVTAKALGLPADAEQLSEEEIYRLLPEDQEGNYLLSDDMLTPPEGAAGQNSGGGGGGQAPRPQNSAQGGGRSSQTPQPQDGTQGNGGSGSRSLADIWRDRLVAAAAAARTQGHLPASIQRIVDALLVPKLDWRRILAEFLTPSRSDWDWRRPDRRILAASGFHIPSLHSEDLEDVVVAIDTSGSIGQDELETFLAEVCEILATSHRTRAWVLTCDAELHAVVEASEQTTPEELAPALNGGGGTDFRPVFDWIRDRGISPACVVYLTDGYGTYPEQQPPYPVLWVLTRDHMTPPWGKTALLEV